MKLATKPSFLKITEFVEDETDKNQMTYPRHRFQSNPEIVIDIWHALRSFHWPLVAVIFGRISPQFRPGNLKAINKRTLFYTDSFDFTIRSRQPRNWTLRNGHGVAMSRGRVQNSLRRLVANFE